MPTKDERLRHIQLKVQRAKKHISDLENELNVYFKGEPVEVSAIADFMKGTVTYYVQNIKPVPDSVSLLAGDAIHNLMCALDHLAYQIVCQDTNDKPPKPRNIYFPIAESFKKYSDKKRNCLEGATKASSDSFDTFKPYKGGNDTLFTLQALNNIEKHRLLLTALFNKAGIDIGQMFINHGKANMPQEQVSLLRSLNQYLFLSKPGEVLKIGQSIYTDKIEGNTVGEQKFTFELALFEPNVLEEAILMFLNRAFSEVEKVVQNLTSLLR